MNKKGFYCLITFVLIINIIMSFNLHLKRNKFISESQFKTDIENLINASNDKHENNKTVDNLKIEKCQDITDKRFVVYSFYNLKYNCKNCGFCIYQKAYDHKWNRINFGWGGIKFDTTFINLGSDQVYLAVYGMNDEGKKQVYKCNNGGKESIEEFAEDYFLKIYPMNGGIKFNPI